MAYRSRTCQHLMPTLSVPEMPPAHTLAKLVPFMRTFMDCATAFDAVDDGGTWTAAEFVTWLDITVREAHATPGGPPR